MATTNMTNIVLRTQIDIWKKNEKNFKIHQSSNEWAIYNEKFMLMHWLNCIIIIVQIQLKFIHSSMSSGIVEVALVGNKLLLCLDLRECRSLSLSPGLILGCLFSFSDPCCIYLGCTPCQDRTGLQSKSIDCKGEGLGSCVELHDGQRHCSFDGFSSTVLVFRGPLPDSRMQAFIGIGSMQLHASFQQS